MYYSGEQVRENEMDTACGTHREGQKCIQGFFWGGHVKEPTLKI